MPNKLEPEKVIGKPEVKKLNPFMSIKHETVRIPYTHQKAGRDTLLHDPDVAAIALKGNFPHERLILEKQWRQSVNSFVYEIPAGKIDPRDHGDPKHAMLRELNEELRLKPSGITKVFEQPLYLSPGCSNEKMYFFAVDGLKSVAKKLPRDKGEFMHLTSVSMHQAAKMLAKGQIKDAKTAFAITYWTGIHMTQEMSDDTQLVQQFLDAKKKQKK